MKCLNARLKKSSRVDLSVLFLLLLVSYPLQAEDIKEPKTGVSFPERMTVDKTELLLAGVGVRTRLVVKVYAAALYFEASIKTDLSKFKDRLEKPDQAVYDAILQSPAAKLFVLHFVRDVDGTKIQEAFREGIEKSIDADDPAIQKDADTFLNASGEDVKQGDVLKIYVKGEEVKIFKPTGTSEAVTNGKLAPAVTGIWLGRKPVSDDLKKELISRLFSACFTYLPMIRARSQVSRLPLLG